MIMIWGKGILDKENQYQFACCLCWCTIFFSHFIHSIVCTVALCCLTQTMSSHIFQFLLLRLQLSTFWFLSSWRRARLTSTSSHNLTHRLKKKPKPKQLRDSENLCWILLNSSWTKRRQRVGTLLMMYFDDAETHTKNIPYSSTTHTLWSHRIESLHITSICVLQNTLWWW